MICIYCSRTDVDSAQGANDNYVYRPIVVEPGQAPIRFSVDNMCIDCADVVEHFVRSGIRAWEKSLRPSNLNQMDLFEDAELPPIARFLALRAKHDN